MVKEKNITQFNKDAAKRGGYEYSNSERLSAKIASKRISKTVLKLARVQGKSIIDIGCGDGTYTLELLEAGASEVLGVDAAEAAVELAKRKILGRRNIEFKTLNIYNLDKIGRVYDIAVVRGILHHLYDVEKAVEKICHIAKEMIVLEPNGYSPVLKIIEKTSKYHIAHEEKSYPPHLLDRWFEQQGATVIEYDYINVVPFFCPDIIAKILDAVTPIVEKIPIVRNFCCAQYVQKILGPKATSSDPF